MNLGTRIPLLLLVALATAAASGHAADPPKPGPAGPPPGAKPQPHEVTNTVAPTSSELVTWSYLKMNHPDEVVSMLKHVQAGKAPASSVDGLATPSAMTEILKKNWSAAPVHQATTEKPQTSPMAVTWHATTASVLPSLVNQIAEGSVATLSYSVYGHGSEARSTWIECPYDGQVTATVSGSASFKLARLADYDGTVTGSGNNSALKPWEQRTSAPFQLSVRAGQMIKVTVDFDVKLGDKAGDVKGTLELKGAGWSRSVPLDGVIKGLNGSVTVNDERDVLVVADRSLTSNLAVPFPVKIANDSQAYSGTISAKTMPAGVSLQAPVTYSIGAHETKTVNLPLVVDPKRVALGWDKFSVEFKLPGDSGPIEFAIDALQSVKHWTYSKNDGTVTTNMSLTLTSGGGNAFSYNMKIGAPDFFVHTQGSATVRGHTWNDDNPSISWAPTSAKDWDDYLGSPVQFKYAYGYINPIWPF